MPESFNVLVKEIRSLGIDIELENEQAKFVGKLIRKNFCLEKNFERFAEYF